MSNDIKIKAYKYPDIPHYQWEGNLIDQTPEYVVVVGKPGRTFIHHTKNLTATINSTTIEYFSLNRWFNAIMEVEDGTIVSYYCNIAKPSMLVGDEIQFVDLDLDFVREKHEVKWEVLDEDEFESNSVKYGYPEELKLEALRALECLKNMVKNKRYPFNKQFLIDYSKKI